MLNLIHTLCMRLFFLFLLHPVFFGSVFLPLLLLFFVMAISVPFASRTSFMLAIALFIFPPVLLMVALKPLPFSLLHNLLQLFNIFCDDFKWFQKGKIPLNIFVILKQER
uniref:Uncharacterized protein n=1 Tax=Arundo donax TaxID=35708 RepID=A0A0A9HC11_ARUDO